MIKWLYSLLAFILVATFVSGLTTHVFLSELGKNNVTDMINEKSDIYAEQNLNNFYSQLTQGQKSEIDQIKSLSVKQKAAALSPQCMQVSLKDQPFCDKDFISGKITFDESVKRASRKQFTDAMNEAVTQLKDKFSSYEKYSSISLSIISGILALIFYILADNPLLGIQKFFGNSSWVAFLSALSFRFMPDFLDRLVSSLQQSTPDPMTASLTKEVIFSWVTPAMHSAFIAGTWIAVISFIAWISIKFFRNNKLSFT